MSLEIIILMLAVILAGCSGQEVGSTVVPAPQISTVDNNIVTPTVPEAGIEPTPTLVTAELEATLVSVEPPIQSNLALEVDNLLNSYVGNGTFSGSVLVARNGQVLLSRGYGFADRRASVANMPQTRFRIGSITKQFTAAAVLLLQEQGRLNVQDAICDYLTDCPFAWQGITIHHLLSHTSGIPDLTNFPDYRSLRATPSPPMETLNYFNERPLDFPSGSAWRYSNSGYIVLGLVLEQAAGQSYEVFLQENIFTPLNMVNTGYDHHTNGLAVGYLGDSEADFIDMSIPFAAGGLYSTVEDLHLWGRALFNGSLLSQDALAVMVSEQAAIPGPAGSAYGYGWVIGEEDGRRVFEHRGAIEGFVSVIGHYPDENVFIVLLSNLQNSPLNDLYASLNNLVFGYG